MSAIRLLIVDDSPTVRGLIRRTLAMEADIRVVGEAEHPLQAREMIKSLDPDVITLDIEMPHMSGLDFLEKIMRLRPMPVIIVSTLSKRGAEETLRALELGAIDCVEKPNPDNPESFNDLAGRIRMAARANAVIRSAHKALASRRPAAPDRCRGAVGDRVVAIGASTGGVEALLAILSEFPSDCPPTVIVQHMPPVFTRTFAERLDRKCAPMVAEATHGALLQPGTVYLAPGGAAHLEVVGNESLRCSLRNAPRVRNHCPSVDVLFASAAKACGPKAIGVILTGMGADGANGLLQMREAGSYTIAQDEGSSVVYGMPRAAVECGAAKRQLPLHRIASEILRASVSSEASP